MEEQACSQTNLDGINNRDSSQQLLSSTKLILQSAWIVTSDLSSEKICSYFCTAGGSRIFSASHGLTSAGLRIINTASCAAGYENTLAALAEPFPRFFWDVYGLNELHCSIK